LPPHLLSITYDPAREIAGPGWPRTAVIDEQTLVTVFFALDAGRPMALFHPLAALKSE
jgi:hypothetical protein